MAVYGVQQPTELILYNGDGDPYFARYSYSFEGFGTASTAEPPGQIIAKARAATTGVALPPADESLFAGMLPQTRVVVRRYSEQTGQARITVEWGLRYGGSGGAGPATAHRSSTVVSTGYEQPFVLYSPSGVEVSEPYGNRTIERVRTRVQYSSLITATGSDADLVDETIEGNIGKLFVYNNVQRILVGGGYRPISAVQGYVSTTFDRLGPAQGVGEGDIVNHTGVRNRLVQALLPNQVYKLPSPTSGTLAEPIETTYELGDIANLGWLS